MAVIAPGLFALTAFGVMVNVTEPLPAGTVTLAGTPASGFVLFSSTSSPPDYLRRTARRARLSD